MNSPELKKSLENNNTIGSILKSTGLVVMLSSLLLSFGERNFIESSLNLAVGGGVVFLAGVGIEKFKSNSNQELN